MQMIRSCWLCLLSAFVSHRHLFLLFGNSSQLKKEYQIQTREYNSEYTQQFTSFLVYLSYSSSFLYKCLELFGRLDSPLFCTLWFRLVYFLFSQCWNVDVDQDVNVGELPLSTHNPQGLLLLLRLRFFFCAGQENVLRSGLDFRSDTSRICKAPSFASSFVLSSYMGTYKWRLNVRNSKPVSIA